MSSDDKPEGYVTGRPTEYRDNFPDELIKHCGQGYSYASFAGHVSVDRAQLTRWEEKYPAFRNAKKIAMEKSRERIEKILIGQATGVLKGNPAAAIFIAKNRIGWSDNPNGLGDDTIEDLVFSED